MCLVPQKPRTRVRWMRTGTANLSANFTALPNRASMASPYFSSHAGLPGHRRVVVQDRSGAGEDDDVGAVVAVEVERDPRLPPDVREPPGVRLTVGQQAVAAVPEEPDRVRLRVPSRPTVVSQIVISPVSRRRTRSP